MEHDDPAVSVDELSAMLGELLENREVVADLAAELERPDLLRLRDATIAAARTALERLGLAEMIRFTDCLARERGALLAVAGNKGH